MQKQIVVNSTPNEIRVGILEDHELVEFSIERADARRMVGNVYKGIVTAVRPGLQAAFVDIGLDKAGFLHVSDLVHDTPDDDDEGRRGRGRGRPREGLRPIESMVREGQTLLVQVTKEAISTKGPRLTADISLPGRFLVLMPMGDHVGVSRKIEDRDERMRLKGLLGALRPSEGAYIIRTAGEGISEKLLRSDMDYLKNLWDELKARSGTAQAPALVHEDVGLIVGMVRDIFTDDVDALHIDNRDDYRRLHEYVKTFAPDLRERIHNYTGDEPIFDKFGIETELKRSLERKVWMKKGGYIVIDEAEALVAIDVNTGRYTGKRNQEETILQTNMLAAREIARQLRLRDIGGIIVIDFIDMENEGDKRKVLNELRTHLKRDRSRTKTFAVSDLGLVEMSRQRVRQSLREMVSDVCPFCQGTSRVFSLDTLANKVERLLIKACAIGRERALQVHVSPSVAIHLLTERRTALASIAEHFGAKIDVLDDPRVHRQDLCIWSLSRQQDITVELDGPPASAFDGRRRRDVSETRRAARDSGRLHERAESGERSDRPERGERSERSDRGERSGRDGRRGSRRDEPRAERGRGDRPSEDRGRGRGRDRDRDRSRQRDRGPELEREEVRGAQGLDRERGDRPADRADRSLDRADRPLDRADRPVDRAEPRERSERGGRGRDRRGRGRDRDRDRGGRERGVDRSVDRSFEPTAERASDRNLDRPADREGFDSIDIAAPRADEGRGFDRGRDRDFGRRRDRDRGRGGDRDRGLDRDRGFDRDRPPDSSIGAEARTEAPGPLAGDARDDEARGVRRRRRRGRRRPREGGEDRAQPMGMTGRDGEVTAGYDDPPIARDEAIADPDSGYAPGYAATGSSDGFEPDTATAGGGQRSAEDADFGGESRPRRRRRSRRDASRRGDSAPADRATQETGGPLEAMAESAGAPVGNGGGSPPDRGFAMHDDDDRQPPHVEHTAPPADDDMGYGVSFVPDADDDAIDAGGDRPRRSRRRRRRSN